MLLLDGRSFSNVHPNTPEEQTVEKERRENMKSEHANHRKVLASFLEEIPKNKGWWYRLPLPPMSSKDGMPITTDVILPHLGTVFGLSEQATLLFLVEMGACQARGKGHIMNPKGWDDLEAEFKAKSHIELSKTSFNKQSGINLIRLGFPEHKPAVIWRMCKQGEIKAPPRAISSHTSAKGKEGRFRKDRQGGTQGGLFGAWANVPASRWNVFTPECQTWCRDS
jgi:hypothetical protein